MTDTYAGFCKSDFRFPKFHLTTHYPDVIREFGSLHTVSSAHGERTHKTEVKPAHRRTSRKKRTAQGELLDVLQVKESLEQLTAAFGISGGGGRGPGGMRSVRSSTNVQFGRSFTRTPGSTLSGYVTSDHIFQEKKITLKNYSHKSIPAEFRLPSHEAAFRG